MLSGAVAGGHRGIRLLPLGREGAAGGRGPGAAGLLLLAVHLAWPAGDSLLLPPLATAALPRTLLLRAIPHTGSYSRGPGLIGGE